jgi:hypothetical protein
MKCRLVRVYVIIQSYLIRTIHDTFDTYYTSDLAALETYVPITGFFGVFGSNRTRTLGWSGVARAAQHDPLRSFPIILQI